MNWLLLKNSLLLGSLATALAITFGWMSALWLTGLARHWRNLFLVFALIALALPPFLVTNCWLHYFGLAGVWRPWLPVNIISLPGGAWILALLLWPITLLAVLSAWRRLEPWHLESDPALAGWPLIRILLFPMARTALSQAAVLTLVLVLNNFAVPAILQIKVFPAEMWVRFNTAFDTAGALKLGWPMIAGPLLLLLWLRRGDFPWPHLEAPVSPKLFRQQLGRFWFSASGAVTLVLVSISVGVPLFQIVSVRRTWTELPGALAAGQAALWNSFSFAVAAASLVIVFGLLLRFPSSFGVRSRFGFQLSGFTFASGLTWLLFLLPGVILGIALIQIFNWPLFSVFYHSAGIVILAFALRYLALGWNTIQHGTRSVDRDLVDVARLEGATRWQMLRYVLWPQLAPQIRAAWYMVFLLCLWDVESILLVVPPGGETLALRVFNLLHYGYNAQVNALCLTLLVIAVAPLLLWKAARAALHSLSIVKHNVSRHVLLAPAALFVLPGCAPSGSGQFESQLFGRVEIIGTRGTGVGQLNKPRSVAVDLQDNLYVVDMTGRVQKFSPEGAFLLSWQMPQTDLGKPKGMCRDRAGNIVVLEPHYSRVNHFSTAGKLAGQWGAHGTNAGQLSLPRAVAVNSRNEMLVSEYQEAERVQTFSLDPFPSGQPRYLASLGHAGTGHGEFNRPEGLCVDAQDRLYVADSCNHRIEIFSSDGKFLRTYGRPGRGKGELSYPYDICVDSAGRQYVCEFGNSRIQIFDAQDRPLEIIGGPGAEPGRFGNPWGVALDSAGNLYVADSQNHRVQKLIRHSSIATRF